MTNADWTERTIHGIPMGQTIDIPLTVTGGESPGAALIALNAGRAIAAYQHVDELAELDKGTLYYLLNDVRKLAAAAETIEEELILKYRAAGASWAELAAALDIGSRQVAKERHGRIERANQRGLNTRGLAEQADAEDGDHMTVSASGDAVIVTGRRNVRIIRNDQTNGPQSL